MEYPEHDKMSAIKNESQAIGAFLEWLLAGGVEICKWRDSGNNGEPFYLQHIVGEDGTCNSCGDDHCTPEHYPAGTVLYEHEDTGRITSSVGVLYRKRNPDYEGWNEGFYPINKRIEQYLADYFEIDLNKIESEKRQILESLRKAA